PPAAAPLCPYTTLFRALRKSQPLSPPPLPQGERGFIPCELMHCRQLQRLSPSLLAGEGLGERGKKPHTPETKKPGLHCRPGFLRSEEHTSELQSRENLV